MALEIEPTRRLVILATNRYATWTRRARSSAAAAKLKGSFQATAAPNALVVGRRGAAGPARGRPAREDDPGIAAT